MLLVFVPFGTVAQTAPLEIKIVTGNEFGEYYTIAKDIEKIAQQEKLDIDVIPTKGTLQNIHDVFSYESITLGIGQGDVLAYLNMFDNDDEEARQKAENLRMVLPLYKEQVHLITRPEIKSLKDLNGKKISLGEEGSGTTMTASTLLVQWEIKPEELRFYEVRRAIAALRQGEIDALFYVIGVPSQVLQEQILPEDNFHFLPVNLATTKDDEFYNKIYIPDTLPANSYSWQKEAVETLAIQSFLFTVEDKNCDQVTPVASLVKNKLSVLQQNGLPIWKKIDLKPIHNQKPERMSKCVNS